MAKEQAPAFQFYPRDFIADGDQAALSLEQVGAYIRMLSYAWLKVGLPDDPDKIARMIRAEVETVSLVLSEHFQRVEGPCGARFVNQRQEEERRKQAKFRRQQQLKGRASANRRSTAVQPEINHGSTVVQPEGNSSSASSSASSVQEHVHAPAKRKTVEEVFGSEEQEDAAGWLLRSWHVWYREERNGASIVMRDARDWPVAKAIVETWPDRAYLEKLARAFMSSTGDRLKWCPARTLPQFASEASGLDVWLRESA